MSLEAEIKKLLYEAVEDTELGRKIFLEREPFVDVRFDSGEWGNLLTAKLAALDEAVTRLAREFDRLHGVAKDGPED